MRAQEEPIAAQLAAGVRYLDLRVCALRDGDAPVRYFVHHTFLGAPLEAVLDEADAFNRAHPRELLILDFQRLSGFTNTDRRWLARALKDRFGARLVPSTETLSELTLSVMWGRQESVVALLEHAPAADAHVFDRAKNLDSDWFNVASVRGLRDALASAAGASPRRLHVLQWQLTPGVREILAHPGATLKDWAEGPNRLIADGTLRKLLKPSGMNVVMADDVSSVAGSIARLNE